MEKFTPSELTPSSELPPLVEAAAILARALVRQKFSQDESHSPLDIQSDQSVHGPHENH